jgi:predicted RND superfamily exporter protein
MTGDPGTGQPGPPRKWRALAGLVLLGFAAFTALGLVRLEFDTSVSTFLWDDDPVRQAYVQDEVKFGSDPITVVLQGADEDRWLTTEQLPRIIGLEGELASLEGVRVVYGPGTVLNQLAASAQNFLSDISLKREEVVATAEQRAREAGAVPAEVAKAKKEAVRAFDLRYGVLLTQALPAGLPTLSNQAFIDAVSFDGAEPRPTLRFVAPDTDTIALIVRPDGGLTQGEIAELVTAIRERVRDADLEADKVLVSGSPVVLAAVVEQTRFEVPLLTLASFAVVGLLLAVGARRQRGLQRWVAIIVPLAASGWAVLLDLALLGWFDEPASLVLVAVLPAVIGIGSDAPHYLGLFGPSRRVVANTIATAAGSAMTALSPVPFIQQLGILLAVGVVAAGLLGQLMRVVVGAGVPPAATATDGPEGPESTRGVRVARVLLGATACAAAAGWLLLPTIPLEADLAGLADGLPVEAEATQSQEALGVAGQVDVLLSGTATSPEALAWSREARAAVVAEHGDELRTILSPAQLLGFLGEEPTSQQISSAFALMPSYLLGAVLSPDGTTASMSFGVVPRDIGAQRRLVRDLEETLPPPPDGAEVVVTGVPAVAAREFELLDSSRLTSNFFGVLAPGVLLVLILGWRYRGDAARALLAAGIATGLGLLALRLSGTSLTPLTCALGSLTAAVGCEFTVMLRHRAFPWKDVLVAGSTSTAGYLVLLGSELDVMRNFAVVLALSVVWAGLAAAVVALALPRRPDGRPDVLDPGPARAEVMEAAR